MLLFMLACSGVEKESEEVIFFSPDEQGPYQVLSLEVSMFNSEGEEAPVQLWYPALDVNDELYSYDGLISGSAFEKGSPDCSAPREVIMFSHGNQGIRYQSYFAMEYLASHGYVVAAPRHLDNSFFDYDSAAMPRMIFQRPIDIQNAFELLFTVDTLQGCLDEAKGYAIMGHSFGGYTTVALSGAVIDTNTTANYCADSPYGWLCDEVAAYASENGAGIYDLSDDRIWAGIPMAPAGYEVLLGGLEQVEIPMMVLGAELDSSTTMAEQVEPIFSGMSNARARLGTILGANHYSFSNACDIIPTAEYCSEDGLSLSEAHHVINTLSVAFLGLEKGDQRMQEFIPLDSEALLWTP